MMSTYFKVWNATISGPEPARWIPEPPPVVGRLTTGQPVNQGLEAGTVMWPVMTYAQFIDLWDKWNAGKSTSGTFTLPPRTSGQTWTSWRSVTAYAEEPKYEVEGHLYKNITMRIVITA